MTHVIDARQRADFAEEGIKLRELCDRVGVDYNEARYALARGVLPKGVDAEPGRGNHRRFDAKQAFHLAVALKLKAAGINTTLAGEIADWCMVVQGMAQNLAWDPEFAPFAGLLRTEQEWFIDVGDSKYCRIVTDANPSKVGLDATPWTDMTVRRTCATARPAVVIRVDVARIAALLAGDGSVAKAAGEIVHKPPWPQPDARLKSTFSARNSVNSLDAK